jgi:hypothetical protein
VEIEIHVVSNKDRVAAQLFDCRFEQCVALRACDKLLTLAHSVPTEEFIKQNIELRKTYVPHRLQGVDWELEEHKKTSWMKVLFESTPMELEDVLNAQSAAELLKIITFCEMVHEHDILFGAFGILARLDPLPQSQVTKALKVHPPLVFSILKTNPPSEEGRLTDPFGNFGEHILQTLMRCGNSFAMAVLVALEKLSGCIRDLPVHKYCTLLEVAALCIRPSQVVQEVLLVLHDIRFANPNNTPAATYAHKHALGVAFERTEEAADEAPCDETGKPTKQRTAPPRVKLHHIVSEDDDDKMQVRADIRIDMASNIRLHSLVRLQAASHPEKGWASPWMMDGLVVQSQKGEAKIELLHPPPSEMEDIDWLLYNAGSIGKLTLIRYSIRSHLAVSQCSSYDGCRLEDCHSGSGTLPVCGRDCGKSTPLGTSSGSNSSLWRRSWSGEVK